MKDPAYEDKLVDWILSEYRDESQLLQSSELESRLRVIEGKVLNNEENLFLVQSCLKLCRSKLKFDAQEEQKLAIIMLYFVEKSQREQIHKIPHPLVVARDVLWWTQGKATAVNLVLKTLLESDSLIVSNYLEKFTRWLASEEGDTTHLLVKQELDIALNYAYPNRTNLENNFLVRSAVFALRGE